MEKLTVFDLKENFRKMGNRLKTSKDHWLQVSLLKYTASPHISICPRSDEGLFGTEVLTSLVA